MTVVMPSDQNNDKLSGYCGPGILVHYTFNFIKICVSIIIKFSGDYSNACPLLGIGSHVAEITLCKVILSEEEILK